MSKHASGVERATSKATYAEGAETYLQRQLREFHAPQHARVARVEAHAEWAEPFDLLDGKTSGRRPTRQDETA